MRSVRVSGATNLFGAPKNWDDSKYGPCGGLPVRVNLWPEGSNSATALTQCTSAWKPSATELALLNAGGAVEVSLIMPVQCPMYCGVVADPEKEEVEIGGYDEHGPATP